MVSWSSAHISARTRHAAQPAEPRGVPGAAPGRKGVVICIHKHTKKPSRRGMCTHTQYHTHTHRLHPTPPLHRRSCPVLTGAHLPQPEAINTTTTTTNPPHSTPYQLSFHTLLCLSSSLTQPLSVPLSVSVVFAFVSPPPSCKHTFLSFTREILPCSSAVMKCIFLPLIQSQNAVCRNAL